MPAEVNSGDPIASMLHLQINLYITGIIRSIRIITFAEFAQITKNYSQAAVIKPLQFFPTKQHYLMYSSLYLD